MSRAEAARAAPRGNRSFWLLLTAVALLGLTARLWNLDFDQRQHLHPDERFWALTSDAIRSEPAPAPHGTAIGPILDWLDGQRSPANAYRGTESFLYGPISMATARAAAGWLHRGVTDGDQPASAVAHAIDALGVPLIDEGGVARFDDGYGVDLIGRLQGAVFDTLTLVIIGLIGRRLGGRAVGLAAAAMYAASVLAIQHAHFLGAEPLLGLGCALTVLLTLRLDRGADTRRAAVTGLAAGLAAGLTIAAKLTGVGLAVVPFLGCALLLAHHRRRSDVVRLAAVTLGAAVAFRALNPAAFNGLGLSLSTSFTDDIRRASELGASTAPPSFQWAKRIPVLQPLVWLGVFTIGPGAAIGAMFGAAAIGAELYRRRLGDRLRLMTDVGRWPLFVVAAAAVLPFVYIVRTTVTTGRYFIPMLAGLSAIAGLGVVSAARWARRSRGLDRIAGGGVAVAALGLAAIWGVAFVNGVYGQPNTRIEASHWIADNVPAGSVLSIQAWDDGLPLRLPGVDADAFPSEQLVMVGPDDEAKVATIADQLQTIDYVVESSPRIWGTVVRMPARFPSSINFFEGLDSGALGFQRVATFETGLRLGPWRLDDSAADESFFIVDHPEVRIWEKVRAVDRAGVIAVLDPVAASNAIAVDPTDATSNGLILYDDEIAANASGPTYTEAFDTEGSSLLHALGWFALLELVGLAAFVLFAPLLRRLPDAGLGLSKTLALATLSFAIFVAAAWLDITIGRPLIVAITVAFVASAVIVGRRTRVSLAALWHDRRSTLIAVEIVTAVVFVAFALLRATNPDLWHPARSGEKPFELTFLTAVLRTRTLPTYDPWFSGGALNYYSGGWFLLSVPARLLRTSPAMTMNLGIALFASCASGSAFSVAAGVVGAGRRAVRRRTAILTGALAVVFVLLMGNPAILRSLWLIISGGRMVGTGGAEGKVDWWSLSRLIPDGNAITEFPAWSLLFADLHPHVMGITVLLTCAGCSLAMHGALTAGRRAHTALLAVLLGGLLGFVRMTNTWDLPLAAGVAGSTFVVAALGRTPWRRCIAPMLLVAAMVVVAWAPYSWRGQVYDAGFDPARFRTRLGDWIQQYGFFVAVSVLVVAVHLRPARRRSPHVWRRLRNTDLVAAATASIALGYVALRPGRGTFVACVLLALGCAWVAWRLARDPAAKFAPLGPLLLAVGWIIPAGVEMLTVRNDLGRQNTVFKFWYQAWIVLGIGSAVVIGERLAARRNGGLGRRWPGRAATVLLGAATVLSVGFWSLTVPVRNDDRISTGGITLDGDRYLDPTLEPPLVMAVGDRSFDLADDLPLVDWLRDNVHGIQVVAEAPGEDYRWTGRIAWLTGLATPIGWSYHESQQKRPLGGVIQSRKDDMTALYTTTDPVVMARVLSRFSARFLVFGTQEQVLASPESAAALRSFECLDIVTTGRDTTDDVTVADGPAPASGDDTFYVATVDLPCVNRLRPLPVAPPPG